MRQMEVEGQLAMRCDGTRGARKWLLVPVAGQSTPQNAAPHPTGRCDDVLKKVQAAQCSSDRGRGGRVGGDTAAQRSAAKRLENKSSNFQGQKGKRGSPVSVSVSPRGGDADTSIAASTTARTNPRWASPRRHRSCGMRDALWLVVCEWAALFLFLCCTVSAQAVLDERSWSRRPISLSLCWEYRAAAKML